jgi:hypothetical protein
MGHIDERGIVLLIAKRRYFRLLLVIVWKLGIFDVTNVVCQRIDNSRVYTVLETKGLCQNLWIIICVNFNSGRSIIS